jgi:hypothetical protein
MVMDFFAMFYSVIMRKKTIMVPEKLNLELTVQNNPTDFKFDFEYAYSLLHQILIGTCFKISKVKDWKNFKESKPIRLYMLRRSSALLQRNRHDYNKYLDFLYLNNIIWRSPYSENVCRGYQLAPAYFSEKVRFIEIYDRKVISILAPKDNDDKKDHHPLNKWFDSKLKIESQEALMTLNSIFEETLNWKKYLSSCLNVMGIENGDYYFSRRSYTDDRFHSTFSGIPKTLRPFLSYDGKRLGEVDISSSVPFFLYYHLLTFLEGNKRVNQQYFDKFFQNDKFYKNALRRTKLKVKLDEGEVLQFGRVLLEGNFYKQFMNVVTEDYYERNGWKILNRRYNKSEEDKISILKKCLLSSINAKKNQYQDTQEIFRELYPTIYKFLTTLKDRNYLNSKNRKKLLAIFNGNEKRLKKKFQKHKKAAHLFLQTESFFMLDVVARTLNKKHSKVPFFTLHDCIVTTEENLEFLESFMKETFTVTIGFAPNFKSKKFSPQQDLQDVC